ncbi:MAG: alpha/beta hydrolase [Rhodospirillales bacterium 70-18]|nr:alpha/beta hydrolase [Rhodospirillales bacterium]OJY64879.1 MAG: alpha/beta hydrolase [Rhodospirillales bacterium 70-18]
MDDPAVTEDTVQDGRVQDERAGRLDRGDGVELAWAHLPGRSPTVVFLPGFKSDMDGIKATTLRDFCAATGQAMLRLDYSGHGRSGGAFTDGTIGRWAEDARAVIEHVVGGERLLLVGSSMGGWIGLLLGREMPGRLAALVGIAAAPDFTETLMWQSMTFEERARLDRDGHIDVPSEYGEPYRITRGLIEDGRRQMVLGGPIPIGCKVRLLQGQRDADVPWETALTLAERLESQDVMVALVKDGDHRLSRLDDLALLTRVVAALLFQDGA